MATINVGQMVAKNMVEHKRMGSIVNVSSQAAKAALIDHTAYGASKGAVDQATRNMALELGPYGIRVNSVNPTVVKTEMGVRIWSENPEEEAAMKAKIPLGRFAEVNEIVDVILFLLSDKSTMISGANVPIDGGFLAT